MAHRIIPRSEWGARHRGGFYDRPVGRLRRYLHHSVTIAPDLVPPFTDDYTAVRSLESIGQSRFGGGISYTFAITPAGLIFEGHGIGRTGAHTAGFNTVSAGIVLVGNYEKDTPPGPMLAALDWLLHEGVRRRWWTSPTLTGGHRDTKGTACPGINAYRLIPAINAGEYHGATPTSTGGFMADMSEKEKRELLAGVAETRKLAGETHTMAEQNRDKLERLEKDAKTRHLADLGRHRALAKVVETLDLNLDEAALRAQLRAAVEGIDITITTKES